MKTKPIVSRAPSALASSASTSTSSPSALSYTEKTSVRSSPETNNSYAIDLSLNSTGTHLAVLTVPTTIQIVDSTTLKSITSLTPHAYSFDSTNPSTNITVNAIQYAMVSPHTIFAATSQNLVLAWDTRTPQQETFQLNGNADVKKFLSLASNNDDRIVAAGSELKGEENVGIAFWDIRTSNEKQLLHYFTESHSDDILQLEFSRIQSNRLISGSTDGLVCLYDVSKSDEDDALEQVYNANCPISKCGFAQHNSVYAITASNGFFIWSTADENQELLVQGDTEAEFVLPQSTTTTETMDTTISSSTSAKIQHLPSTHTTIVDLLYGSNIRDFLPTFSPSTDSTWPLLLCDHMGKMSVALVSSDETQPTIFNLESPHSEPLRAAIAYRSSIYSCGDDGQVVRWQPSTTSSNNSNNNKNSMESAIPSRSKTKSNSKTRPY